MKILFNIVYVRGTVAYLLPFLGTLLKHSSCDYRLVANGCMPAEVEMLKDFCLYQPRARFYLLSNDIIIPHSDALNHLLQLNDSAYFAFMDSDIFAVGEWLNPHLEALTSHHVIFAGLPIWQEISTAVWEADHPIMAGRSIVASSGQTLGATYYAIYQRELMQACVEKYAIGFDQYSWDDLALPVRQLLEKEGLRAQKYDTGKVLNILLQIEGASLEYLPTSSLVHVGAASEPAQWAQQHSQQSALTRLPTLRNKVRSWRKRLKAQLLRFIMGRSSRQRESERVTQTRRAANAILIHLTNHQSLPSSEPWLLLLSPQMQVKFLTLGSQILEIYKNDEVNIARSKNESKKLGVLP